MECRYVVEFNTISVDCRTGVTVVEVVLIQEDYYVHSGYCGTGYVRNGGLQKGSRVVIDTIDHCIGYSEEKELREFILANASELIKV